MQTRHLVQLVGRIRTLKTKIITLFKGIPHRPWPASWLGCQSSWLL